MLVFASTLVWHASNFAFNAVTARLLGPGGYSELAATVSILYVSSPLLTSIQTLMSRSATSLSISGSDDGIRALVRTTARRVIAVGVVVAGTGAAASHRIAAFLHLHSGWPVVIVCAGLCLSGVTHCQRGVLQGMQRFGRYSASTVVEASVKVLGAAILVGAFSRSVDAAVLAIPVAALCALAANAAFLRFLPRAPGVAAHARLSSARRPLATVATFVLLALLLSADVLAAKRYLPSHAAGLYAAVSLSGKIVYFATSALSAFLFPLFSERRERNLDGRPQLAVALTAICACSAGLVGVYALIPKLVILPLFGSRYLAASHYLAQIALAFAGYAVAYLAATYLVARGARIGAAILVAAAVMQLAGLYDRHASISQIVHVQVVVLWAAALALVAAAFAPRRAETRTHTLHARTEAERRIVQALVEAAGPNPVILSGSRALGDARADSDYDLVVPLPFRAIPTRLRRLRRVAEELSIELGVDVSVNPLPVSRLEHAHGLYAWKLRREGRLLVEPDGFELEDVPLRLEAVHEFSYLASAALYLLRSLSEPVIAAIDPATLEPGVRKALLHLAQVRLLRRDLYRDSLRDALLVLDDEHLGELAREPAATAFLGVRDEVLGELDPLVDRVRRVRVLRTNARYAVLAALRGRGRVLGVASRTRIDCSLAGACSELLRSVRAVGVEPQRRQAWQARQAMVLREWPDAHPLAAQ
jgi:O-antigen/teichoic acid export membrane protein/predicted nucleotidyltransferase